MKSTRPEVGLERLLAAIERDILDTSDEEIASVASELGIKPDMKGSIALFGVTRAVRRQGSIGTKAGVDATSHHARAGKIEDQGK